MKNLLSLITVATLAPVITQAAIVPIDSLTLTPDNNVDTDEIYSMTDFTVEGVTYTATGATSWTGGSQFVFKADSYTPAVTDTNTDNFVSAGVANTTGTFQFGTSVEDNVFAIVELVGNDDITLELVDSSGTGLGATLDIASSDWSGDLWTGAYSSNGDRAGVGFYTSDFTGGTTVGAEGFEITSGSIDNFNVATAAVPEPSTYTLLAGLATLGLLIRRRLKQ